MRAASILALYALSGAFVEQSRASERESKVFFDEFIWGRSELDDMQHVRKIAIHFYLSQINRATYCALIGKASSLCLQKSPDIIQEIFDLMEKNEVPEDIRPFLVREIALHFGLGAELVK